MPDVSERIRDNLTRVRRQIADAAARSGRAAEQVRLVAVTKSVGEAAIRALVEAGCHELGENRPQQLWQRAARLADLPIRWHMIGTLQKNKIRRTLPLIQMLHSADSQSLVGGRGTNCGRVVPASANPSGGQRFRRGVQARVGAGGGWAVVGGIGSLGARRSPRADVHGRARRGPGAGPARFRRPARAPRPAPAGLPRSRFAGRAFHGDERRLRGGDRRGGDDRAQSGRPCSRGPTRTPEVLRTSEVEGAEG